MVSFYPKLLMLLTESNLENRVLNHGKLAQIDIFSLFLLNKIVISLENPSHTL